MDSCLSSPLLPPLLRSSTKLRGLVRSFPPTEVQLPYHVTAAPTNQSCSQSATMMDSTARMQHVSGAARTTAAGAPTSFFVAPLLAVVISSSTILVLYGIAVVRDFFPIVPTSHYSVNNDLSSFNDQRPRCVCKSSNDRFKNRQFFAKKRNHHRTRSETSIDPHSLHHRFFKAIRPERHRYRDRGKLSESHEGELVLPRQKLVWQLRQLCSQLPPGPTRPAGFEPLRRAGTPPLRRRSSYSASS